VDHGVVFEPHLQNIVLFVENNLPAHVYIRDLEGTKLSAWHHQSKTDTNTSDTIYYDFDKSFRRLTYCLIFNNFASAIHFISDKNSNLEIKLWVKLYDIINSYNSRNQLDKVIKSQLNDLLTAEYLPYKANLLTRFFKHADKNAYYINFPNPLRKAYNEGINDE
jgi:siderophore synthetase component